MIVGIKHSQSHTIQQNYTDCDFFKISDYSVKEVTLQVLEALSVYNAFTLNLCSGMLQKMVAQRERLRQ